MELSTKSKVIKKETKKRKLESVLVPLIEPGKFDGVSNWVRMQEALGLATDKTKEVKEKNFWTRSSTKDYRPPHRYKEGIQLSAFMPSHLQGDKKESKDSVKYSDVVKSYCQSPVLSNSPNKEKSKVKSSFIYDDKTNTSVNGENKNEEHETEASDKKLTKAVAMDCEMVGTGPTGEDSIIARVSIVNSLGDCLYDEFVKPKERVTDYRTKISGVRPSDLKKGKDLFQVQADVANIIEGRILVGHSIRHDLDVLFLSHPKHMIRDTAYYKPFRELCGGRTPSLKKLTSRILGCEIQGGEHSSVEDAQAAMLLYLRQKREWEYEIKSRRKRKPRINNNQTES